MKKLTLIIVYIVGVYISLEGLAITLDFEGGIQSLFEYMSNTITELPHLYQVRPNGHNLDGAMYTIYGVSLLAILFGIFLMWAVGSEGSFKEEFETASLISMSITGTIILAIQIKLMYYMWLSKFGWDLILEMAGFILFTPIIVFIFCIPFWLIKSANKANAHGKT